MSSNITNFYGKHYDHLGEVRRGLSREHQLLAVCTRHPDINASITLFPGLCAYGVGATTMSPGMPNQFPRYQVKLGLGVGKAPPIYLLNGDADFDVTIANLPAGVSYPGTADYPLPAISAQPGYVGGTTANVIGIVATSGFEYETTEFDKTQTYVSGQPLRSVLSDSLANAGKFTNQGNTGGSAPDFTSATAMTIGTDTISGYVGVGAHTNAWQRPILSLIAGFNYGSR